MSGHCSTCGNTLCICPIDLPIGEDNEPADIDKFVLDKLALEQYKLMHKILDRLSLLETEVDKLKNEKANKKNTGVL